MRNLTVLALLFFIFAEAKSAALDSLFGSSIAIKEISNPKLEEISGLAFGKFNPGVIYVHTDSGGESAVYILDSLGNELGKITLLGVQNRDWEDIAVGPGPDGQSYIYVGEIGDNLAVHEEIAVFRFPEPEKILPEMKVSPETITLNFPGGARDAETLMIDPITADLFILSKRDSVNTLYRLPAGDFAKGKATLEELIKLPFTSATGGDISQDGTQILIKKYFTKENQANQLQKRYPARPQNCPIYPNHKAKQSDFSRMERPIIRSLKSDLI
jgi:hypothetical protein